MLRVAGMAEAPQRRLQRIVGREVERDEGRAYLSHTGLRHGLLLNSRMPNCHGNASSNDPTIRAIRGCLHNPLVA